ncbi:meiotically up-regulated gene 157 protein [Fennellomyces sp. T-0311]|nr:meiotically up-regulated gene 157 protein [Fennellomyces sp. T-0311]
MPEDCPSNYANYAQEFHEPGSGGPLNLPFQRPVEACRRFTSNVINSAIESLSSKIADVDLARLFTNAYPNTLDTTIQSTSCINSTECSPLSFVITGDIHAMWLRDSANQLLPYIDYVNQDLSLKRLFLGLIYMQASFIKMDPYANAFNEPRSMASTEFVDIDRAYSEQGNITVWERKWEIDSLASFLGFSYQYWNATGDSSFVQSTDWMDAVDAVLQTIRDQQEPTFDDAGHPMDIHYRFERNPEHPNEVQFLYGMGNPVRRTGLVKCLFRPSDDATVYPFFIPGNAMMSVELDRVSQLLHHAANNDPRLMRMKNDTANLSKEIRDAIYKYAIVDFPGYDKVFAYEVDGYGSRLIMDDANVPSLLSLSMLGFVDQNDPVYQNTRRLVLSHDNPYYFSGPRAGGLSGIGGPHVGLNYAWPMSQIVRILSSSDDDEIVEALDIIVRSTDGTGLVHESVNVFDNDGMKYTRPWFAWVNGLFGQAILKLAKERPHLLFERRYAD